MEYLIKNNRNTFQDQYPKMYPEEAEEVLHLSPEDSIITKNITFVVTENCNLRCTYCSECGKNQTKRMTKEVARKAVDTILDQKKLNKYIDFNKHKCVILEFIGGEPLLEIDIIDYENKLMYGVDIFKNKSIRLYIDHVDRI